MASPNLFDRIWLGVQNTIRKKINKILHIPSPNLFDRTWLYTWIAQISPLAPNSNNEVISSQQAMKPGKVVCLIIFMHKWMTYQWKSCIKFYRVSLFVIRIPVRQPQLILRPQMAFNDRSWLYKSHMGKAPEFNQAT